MIITSCHTTAPPMGGPPITRSTLASNCLFGGQALESNWTSGSGGLPRRRNRGPWRRTPVPTTARQTRAAARHAAFAASLKVILAITAGNLSNSLPWNSLCLSDAADGPLWLRGAHTPNAGVGPAPAARTVASECWCQRSHDGSPWSAGSGGERKVRIGANNLPEAVGENRVI
jgi:hypothetical protein